MILNLLAIGDVVGEPGVAFLEDNLPRLKRRRNVHFTVVNGENASGVGVLPRQAKAIYAAGADVVTLGNHTWNRIQIKDLARKVESGDLPGFHRGRIDLTHGHTALCDNRLFIIPKPRQCKTKILHLAYNPAALFSGDLIDLFLL